MFAHDLVRPSPRQLIDSFGCFVFGLGEGSGVKEGQGGVTADSFLLFLNSNCPGGGFGAPGDGLGAAGGGFFTRSSSGGLPPLPLSLKPPPGAPKPSPVRPKNTV